ncbi:Cornifelin-like [Stylophora pistillata]|uniref:Cornifelin-like n=2 Tax=Stylophora pistillata TaxID=50429 RepID=A0A2B4S297_STYPI|nr:Cornifelin-like [Stylophora pistillata]
MKSFRLQHFVDETKTFVTEAITSIGRVSQSWNMSSEKPGAGYNYMTEEQGAAVPPPYGMQPAQPGYPPAQPGYPPAQPGYPPAQPGYPQPVMTQPAPMQTTNTTVVVTQPAGVILQQGMRDWNSGLCGCFEDCYSLCMGLFCPCILLCDVSQRMGEGCCFPTCCPGALVGLRIKLRAQQNIQGSLCNDFCVVQCCGVCVLCQLSRELNHLGVHQ